MNPTDRADVTGKTFFPQLISEPFSAGLRIAFTSSMIMCLIAAAASWMRGGRTAPAGDETLAFGAPSGDDPGAAPLDEELVPA
jgi:hypothetical protein